MGDLLYFVQIGGSRIRKINITLPYCPREIWKKEIHPAIESHRFNVIVAHRRFGKTVATLNHTIKMAIKNKQPSPQYAYIAPLRTQAKKIAWSYLKYYVSPIPFVKTNESELYIELPTNYRNRAGARIYVIGADNPDSLRGMYFDGVIFDEYAQMKPAVWDEIVRPALADRSGWAVFIGTPKGQNQFYEKYKEALAKEDWYACCYNVEQSQVIPKDELQSMMEDMSENAIRQEFYCDFTASANNVLISIDSINKAANRAVPAVDIRNSPVILGVDVARFGDDTTVIVRRQGLSMWAPVRYKGLDNMQVASVVAGLITEYQPDAVFIDAGRGEGVIDRLRQIGHRNIIEVPFGSQASQIDKYANKRAEMWHEMGRWLNEGGCIPDDPELKSELATPMYDYDSRGRIVLEAKDKIKERIGASPDAADAAALTFAFKVPQKDVRLTNGIPMAKTKYNPFKR